VILNVFKTGINAVSFLPVFLSCVLGVFNSPVATPAYGEFSITFYIGERKIACFVCLCHHPRSHFTKLLTRALFFGPCHCSCIFVPCLTFRVYVAGDLNKTISIVVGVLTTSFARALLGLSR